MKILLINDYGTPTGGAEILMAALREYLKRQGHDVRLFASSAAPKGVASVADDHCFGTLSRFRTLLQSANPSAYFRLRHVLKKFQPDVVHVAVFLTQLSPLILPLLKNVPTLLQILWYRPICLVGSKRLPDDTPCNNPIGKVCYRSGCVPLRDWLPLMLQSKLWHRWRHTAFDKVITTTETVQRSLMADGVNASGTLWLGVTTVPQRPPLSGPPTAVFAGRIVTQKGVDVLVRAFADVVKPVPDAKLIIIGDGPERSAIDQLIHRFQLNAAVSSTGFVPKEKVETFCRQAWVQVIPSMYAESFGLVAAEAMMRGTAVVASDCGGLSDLVDHGRTGWLVPPGQPKPLADALVKLLNDRDLAETAGQNGRDFALQHFREEQYADQMLHTYQDVIHSFETARHAD
jgi:glycosyltransferase involved in cell wall biosynthesis